jgi:hypothetical protein
MRIFTSFFTVAKSRLGYCITLTAFLLLFAGVTMNAQSNHTVTFTGSSTDFNTAEKFSAAANGTDYYITFDATYMYFGAFRTAGTFGSGDNFSIYLDTDPRNTLTAGNGTTAGRAFNGFTPTLPFNADYTSITEQSYTDPINRFNGTWASTGVTPTVFTSTTCREVRIALSDLGNPASVYATLWMGYAGGIFSNAPGLSNEGTAATRTMTGFFGSFPVYKTGITPVTFRTQNTSAANGGGTPIPNLSVASNSSANGDYGDVTITGAVTWTLNGNSSFSGTCTVGSGTTNASRIDLATFGLYVGGRGIGGTAGVLSLNGSSGTILQSTTSTLNFLGAGSINGANTTKLMPSGLTMTLGGAVDFFASGTVPVNFGSGSALQINANGSVVTNAPLYNSGSTLIYNSGSTYGASAEWIPNITSGAGYPGKVIIQNNTAVNFGAATTFRQLSGLLTINSGSGLTLSSAAGGDLKIAAGLTNNNSGTGVGINTNGRALFNVGTGTYTKAGTDNIDFLLLASANTLTLASGTNLNLTNTNVTGALQFSNATATLNMAGTNTVTLAAGTTVAGSTAGAITGSSPTTSILNLAGTTTWNAGGVITSSINVGIQANSGLTISTAGRLSAGYLQINPGGFIGGTNPIVYPASGTLVYNHNSATYGVQALEWPAASGPANVTVNNNGASTGISFANNNITARTLTGTLTLNHDIDLSGSGTPNLTTLNTIANATATVKGAGTFTHSASGSFTTANTAGVNGTLTTIGAVTLPTTTSFTFNNATASQVTGSLMPTTINNLVINNPTAATGTTISSNTLVISGTTTLTAGALILPTGASNLVTMTGLLSAATGTITGSATSNLITNTANTTNIGFTAGGTSLNNWTVNSTFGTSTPLGLNSVVTINGTFLLSGTPDIYTTATGGLIIASGATYSDGGKNANRFLGTGSFNLQSGANLLTGNTSGLNATAISGAIQASGTRTFSGGANYTFSNSVASAQPIGDALDAAGGTGKTGIITGNVVVNNSNSTGVTLNSGTTITVNSPGSFNVGVASTSSAILTAPATSIINGTGTFSLLGNGATSGSTLVTAHANGVNGTVQVSGTVSLNNAGNNNTNFTFNGSVAQTAGALLPATINNLNFSNTFSGAVATPSVTLSSSVATNGTITFAGGTAPLGLVSIGAGNTLTINGILVNTNTSKLIGTSTSNLTIAGSGAFAATAMFATGGGTLNNFTLNRSGATLSAGTSLTIGGTYTATAGVLSLGGGLTLNGPIAFGAGTITGGGNPIIIGGSGTITGNITATSAPLALSGITMNRSAATLSLGSNVTVSNTTGLTLITGNIALGNFNLTSTIATGQLGAGSTSSMIVATGSGQAFITVPTTGFITQTLPVGDGTNYTPVTLAFSANTIGGTVGVRTIASVHPSINSGSTPAANISRYWAFTTTALTNYTYVSTFRFISPGDVTGTETDLKLSKWNGSAWTEYAASSVGSQVLTSPSLTQATGPLNSNDFTGRANSSAVNYVWSGTTNDWNTAGNWTPNGIPSALDNVTIDGTLSAVSASINSGSFSVNNFTLNGTGSFDMASGTALTVNGIVTYGGSATHIIDCSSTFNYAGLASQTIAALNYGNLNLTGAARVLASTGTIGICGTFTPGAGGFTNTGSTINFNGSGTQTIPAFTYNNLSSSSTGARTLVNGGTITVAGAFTPGANIYTVTGSTVVLSSTTGFSFANLPTVVSGNSFNALTINGAAGVFNLPYSASTQNLATTLNVTAGTLVLNPSSSSLANTIAVGTININGGTLDDRSTVSGLSSTLQVSTAWNQTSGIVTNTSTNGIDKIQFTGGGNTTYAGLTAPASFQYFSVQIANNTTTTLSTALAINGISGTNLTVEAGSTMNGAAFLVSTNGTGNSFIVNGTYKTAVISGFSGTSTSALSSTNAPTVTLGSASTVEYTSAGTNPLITARADYANLTVSGTSTSFTFGGTTTVGLNYNQGAGTVGLTSTATPYALNVTGNFGMTGGIFNVLANASATTPTIVTVTGNTITSGVSSISLESTSNTNLNGTGIFQTTDFTTTSTSTNIVDAGTGTFTGNEFRIKGNFSKSGSGTFNVASSSNLIGGFVFNKAGTQTFSYTGTASTYANYIVSSGSTLQMLTGVALGSSNNPYSFFTVNTGGIIDLGQTSVISGGSATVNAANTGFTLASGATLKTGNTSGITASITDLTTNYNVGANYEFSTSTAAQTANFPPTVNSVNNFTINNTAFDVKVNKSITVNGNLSFATGNLDLNGSNNITLGVSASIVGETNLARLLNSGSPSATNGYIGTTRTLSTNPGNVANIGMDITTASSMGSTVIKRFPKIVSSIPTALNSISRVYAIQPTSASTGSTISLNYFDSELNGNTETAPGLVTFNSTGANETVAANYVYIGATATNPTTNTVSYNAANLTTGNTFWTLLNSVKYYTFQDGDWNTGATWVGGAVPPANSDVVINHIVSLSDDSATVNSLMISAAKSVTITSGKDLTVTDAIINNGTLTIQNNANLVQVNNVLNSGTGATVVARNSSALKRLDYTLWSSPVAGQGLYSFSTSTLPNRFYVYNSGTNNYSNSVGFALTGLQYPSPLVAPNGINGTDTNNVQFSTAKGYLIRMPYDHPTAATVWNGNFSGTLPNNGDIPFTMSNGGAGLRFNLVGNPYPSPISMTQFVADNSSNITGTLYFWRETNNNTSNNAYCSWAGGTFTSNGQAQVVNPNGIVRTGQGFIVEAINASTSLVFKNGQRSSDNLNQFFRNGNVNNDVSEANRFWLNLTNASGEFSQMAAGYMTGATNAVDLYDGKNINTGNVLLNSILDNADYTIQGKSLPFSASDVIPLSCKITIAGEYTIAIDHVDGLFTGGTQAIYLKDNLTSTEQNLQTGAYTFTSAAGSFTDRFEIRYESQLGVGNPGFTANSVIIYAHNNEFVINSGNTMMSSVKVFDIRGRLLQERKGINANQTTINGGMANEVLLVQITSEDGITVTRKVIR